MNKEQTDLLLLLRGALWQDGKIACSVQDISWDKIYAIAKEQCVIGVLAGGFCFLDADQCSGDEKLRWLAYVVRLERKNRSLNELIKKLFHKFQSMQLSPVLMKGQAFAVNYPYPLHRQCGDIDVYFKDRKDCEKAVFWSSEIDKTAADSSENKRECKHFTFAIGGNVIELHYFMCLFENPQLQKRLQQIIDEEFANSQPFFAEIDGENIETVPPTLSVLHQIIHISRHLLEAGIGLRQICDLALYLDKYNEQIDRDRLNGYLEELQLMSIARCLGSILVDWLGLEEGKLPFNTNTQYTDFILQEIFEGGNFGKKKVKYREGSNGLCRKILSVFYFYKRCKLYSPLMPLEAKSYFWNKISLNFRLMTKHHY